MEHVRTSVLQYLPKITYAPLYPCIGVVEYFNNLRITLDRKVNGIKYGVKTDSALGVDIRLNTNDTKQ
jgi:hypothetical protein